MRAKNFNKFCKIFTDVICVSKKKDQVHQILQTRSPIQSNLSSVNIFNPNQSTKNIDFKIYALITSSP